MGGASITAMYFLTGPTIQSQSPFDHLDEARGAFLTDDFGGQNVHCIACRWISSAKHKIV
jgi:hypothetical protein